MRLPTLSRPAPAARKRPTVAQVRPSRAVRGLTFLATLIATLVLVGLSAFSVLVWWAPLVGVGAAVASFLWLRAAVQADIKARRARRRPVRRARPDVAATHSATSASAAHSFSGPEPGDVAVEGDVVPAAPVAAATEDVAFGDIDGWKPVPVPPPTYTLKAKAEPREVTSFARPADDVTSADVMPEVVPCAAEDEARAAAYGT